MTQAQTPSPQDPAQKTVALAEALYDDLRGYLPDLLRRLAISFGVPIGASALLATFGAVLLANVLRIPNSTTTLVVLAVNIAILVYGWRYLERRTHATSLFVLYASFSRVRRDIQRLAAHQPNAEAQQWDEAQRAARQSAEAFSKAMQAAGARKRS